MRDAARSRGVPDENAATTVPLRSADAKRRRSAYVSMEDKRPSSENLHVAGQKSLCAGGRLARTGPRLHVPLSSSSISASSSRSFRRPRRSIRGSAWSASLSGRWSDTRGAAELAWSASCTSCACRCGEEEVVRAMGSTNCSPPCWQAGPGSKGVGAIAMSSVASRAGSMIDAVSSGNDKPVPEPGAKTPPSWRWHGGPPGEMAWRIGAAVGCPTLLAAVASSSTSGPPSASAITGRYSISSSRASLCFRFSPNGRTRQMAWR